MKRTIRTLGWRFNADRMVMDYTLKCYVGTSSEIASANRETHALLDDLAEATLDGTRKEHMEFLQTVPLLIDHRRSGPAVSAMLDRLLHHGHVLKCGPRGAGAPKPTCLHRRR